MNNLQHVESPYLRDDVPEFRAGDTVKVHVKVREGGKERIQQVGAALCVAAAASAQPHLRHIPE